MLYVSDNLVRPDSQMTGAIRGWWCCHMAAAIQGHILMVVVIAAVNQQGTVTCSIPTPPRNQFHHLSSVFPIMRLLEQAQANALNIKRYHCSYQDFCHIWNCISKFVGNPARPDSDIHLALMSKSGDIPGSNLKVERDSNPSCASCHLSV